jgi:predicted MFS family arabinose efflux permease
MKKVIINSREVTKNKLSEEIIWVLMYTMSIIHGLMCISPGILSSCISEIKKEFRLSDEKYSMFGTLNGFGSLIGSLIFTIIIENINHKNLICSMLIINCLCHFSFCLKLDYFSLLISRFFSGFASVFCYIYFPIWVDKFAMKNWVNFMQTTVQLSNTAGHILGYFIYLILGSKNWKYGFLTEIFTVTCLVFIMVIIPNQYYDKDFNRKDWDEIKINNLYENEKETITQDIICNIPYILITLYRANRLFIFVALDFWFSDYLQNSLREKNPSIIFYSYSFTMVFSNLGR